MSTLALPSPHEEAWRWSDLDTLRAAADTAPAATGIDPATLFLDIAGPHPMQADPAELLKALDA